MKIEKLADDLWVVDEPMQRLGIDFRHRMTLIRGRKGLVVHSPVACDDELVEALDRIGKVHTVLAPSLFHDLYFPSWLARFPDAQFLCAPGFRAAHPELGFHGDISAAAVADLEVGLQVVLLEGMPRVNECVLFHEPSRTLIVADLVFNFRHDVGAWGRLFLRFNRVHGRVGMSRLFRYFIRDRARFRSSLKRVLELDFERVIVGHGAVIEHDGRRILQAVYDGEV